MQLRHRSLACFALALLSLVTLTASSLAVTPLPLNSPLGLAVDANGNLYVANASGNNILVYNASYVQQTAKTITKGISGPFGVAFDPLGNLWVSNESNGTLTLYTKGVQNTAATISGLSLPGVMTVDSLGDLYIVTVDSSSRYFISVFAPTAPFLPALKLIQTFKTGSSNGNGSLVAAGPALYYSSSGGTTVATASATLASGNFSGGAYSAPIDAFSLAADNKGNVYLGNTNSTVYFAKPTGASLFLTLNYVPWGMAVDNAHKRVYIADGSSKIYVYSTAGVLLHTII